MVPYTYLIGWSKLNTWYYGSRYSKKAQPEDLFSEYFTSSKYVKEYMKINGVPDIIQVRKTFETVEQAVRWENRVIKRLGCVGSDKWLNRGCSGKQFFNDKPNKTSFYKGHTPWNKGRKNCQIPWNKNIKTGKESENTIIKKSLAHKKCYEIFDTEKSTKSIILGLQEFCSNNNYNYPWVLTQVKNGKKYKNLVITEYKGQLS